MAEPVSAARPVAEADSWFTTEPDDRAEEPTARITGDADPATRPAVPAQTTPDATADAIRSSHVDTEEQAVVVDEPAAVADEPATVADEAAPARISADLPAATAPTVDEPVAAADGPTTTLATEDRTAAPATGEAADRTTTDEPTVVMASDEPTAVITADEPVAVIAADETSHAPEATPAADATEPAADAPAADAPATSEPTAAVPAVAELAGAKPAASEPAVPAQAAPVAAAPVTAPAVPAKRAAAKRVSARKAATPVLPATFAAAEPSEEPTLLLPAQGSVPDPFAPPKEILVAPAAPAVEPDDLTKIPGIGPKMAMALAAAGITTYAKLAETDVLSLRAAVTGAGLRLAPTLPSWPEHAKRLR